MISQDEARSRAAQIALKLLLMHGQVELVPVEDLETSRAISRELGKIAAWLRKQIAAGDKLTQSRLAKETGRQVRPPKKLEKQIEALAKKARR